MGSYSLRARMYALISHFFSPARTLNLPVKRWKQSRCLEWLEEIVEDGYEEDFKVKEEEWEKESHLD